MAGAVGAIRRAALRALQPAAAQRLVAGQPIPATHPELLAEGELAPGISAAEFAARRAALADALPAGAVALLPAAPQAFMAGVIPYPYRPDADFLYLTGVTQPHSLAAIQAGGRMTLFVPDDDPWKEQWDGARLTPGAAVECFGAAEAFRMGQMPRVLGEMLAGASAVVCDVDQAAGVRALPAFAAALARDAVAPLRPLLHRLRWRKSAAELALMRRSAELAASSLADCMRASHPGVAEAALAARFEYRCRSGGAQRMAYPPVVAGGPDACTIHYSRNDKAVAGSEVLLFDGGCELHGYASDVTRTWPAGGRFSGPQRAVYDMVLDVHRQCLALCAPGATLRALHQLSVRLLSQGLADLGVLPGRRAEAIAAGPFRRFYPHSLGHWLGMDTHDTSTVGHDSPLEPGVVLTVEPGLYIPDEEEFGLFRGIGVRIEDDVAITAGGHEVLSAAAPVEAAEVEALVGTLRPGQHLGVPRP